MNLLIFPIVHAINFLWFGAAFYYFSIFSGRTLVVLSKFTQKYLKHKKPLQLKKKWMSKTEATMKFLGGMNMALSLLAFTQLYQYQTNSRFSFGWDIFLCCTVAHGTQFAYNIPHLVHSDSAPWFVLKGPMKRIFLMDFFCTLINLFALWHSLQK